MTLELIFIRHAESEDNAKNIHGGQTKANLTKLGQLQARKVAEYLKDENIDIFYISDLPRTMQTAIPIIARHPAADVHYKHQLRERHSGIFEGLPHGTIQKSAEDAKESIIHYRPKGGESMMDLNSRVKTFIDTTILPQKDKTIAIISHGYAIANMIFYLLDITQTPESYDEYNHENTGITIIKITKDNKHILQALNSTKHLA